MNGDRRIDINVVDFYNVGTAHNGFDVCACVKIYFEQTNKQIKD